MSTILIISILVLVSALLAIAVDLDLESFFATTYIEKVKGSWDTKNNNYLFRCYRDTWNLFHLHHACVRGGQDGLVVGLTTVTNDWTLYSNGDNNFKISAKEFDNAPGVSVGRSIRTMRVDPKDVDRSTLIKGSTIFSNCYQQYSSSSNPAHWMMKLGPLYEVSQCQGRDSGKSLFRIPWPKPLKNMYMHQCANPAETNWKWGQNMQSIVTTEMIDSGLLDKKFIYYNDDGFEASNPGESFELTCFEDIYLSTRIGIWMQQEDILMDFRKDAARLYGEPSIVLSSPETMAELISFSKSVSADEEDEDAEDKAVDVQVMSTPAKTVSAADDDEGEKKGLSGESAEKSHGIISMDEEDRLKAVEAAKNLKHVKGMPYCLEGGKTMAKIRVFQRSGTYSLRKFINIDEVVKLAQTYTIEKVEIVTVNASTNIAEQIRLFNDFDVLITPHGSHLANGIFTARPFTKAVIEVAPFAFDRVFYSNYAPALGFAHYIISTGHLTPPQANSGGDRCAFKTVNSFDELACTKKSHAYEGKYPQLMYDCPAKYHTRMCDTLVSIPILQSHLDDLFKHSLCK